MSELEQFRKVHKIVPLHFNTGIHKHIAEVEGDVLTLRPEEQGTQQMFVDTSKISLPSHMVGRGRSPLLEEDWITWCQALYQLIGQMEWIEMRDKFSKTSQKGGEIRKAGLRKVIARRLLLRQRRAGASV